MKKIFIALVAFILCSSSFAQNNAIGANDEFMELLIQMGPELRAPKNIGSYKMLEGLDAPIDNKLAYKFLWQKNQYVKEEEANCNSIGFMLNKEAGIATLFFYKGKSDNLMFFIDVQTYNYKTGKLIDQLNQVGGFTKDNAACNMQINSFNEIEIKTLAAGETNTVVLNISNKGKIKR
ncbi:MAG: hypothetical protein KA319_00915 [Ferruginibacter sp.]|nr:hypothetical protein [Ferruginibacter sp.]